MRTFAEHTLLATLHPEKTTMFHPRPDEYVIIFPVTQR